MFEVMTFVARANSTNFNGAGTRMPIITPSGVHYKIYIDSPGQDVVYRKSTNGVTWSEPVIVFAGTATNLAVWYDRWSNISAGLIHCAYTDTGVDDTFYRSIDTENSDTLATERTIFAGASAATGGALSIVRARGGNLYCKTMIDAGAEGGFFRSVDVGVNWTSRTDSEALATTDQWLLVPGFAADNQDIMCIFWDASADEVSRYVHDDSGNSWAETSIATTMVDVVATVTYPHFAAAVDLTNSVICVVVWSGVDTANADLRYFEISESAITEGTNVVLNSTDDQGCCAIGIDTTTGDRYVFYFGESAGGNTWSTAVQGYYKKSTDRGANWGSETPFTPSSSSFGVTGLWCAPRFATLPSVDFMGDGTVPLYAVTTVPTIPPAQLINSQGLVG